MSAKIRAYTLLPMDIVDSSIMKDLSVEYFSIGSDYAHVCKCYTASVERHFLGVPRTYGIVAASEAGVDIEDETSEGYPLPENLREVDLYNYQQPIVDQIIQTAQDYYDFQVEAHTGSGKTVMALEAIRRLGRSALILVDQEFLRDQWFEAAERFLGLKRSQMGIIQGSVCHYRYPLVVGMIQTLYKRKLPQEVYDYFGTMVIDEFHVAGAPQFQKVLMQFNATTRFGISATIKRTDDLQKVLNLNFGDKVIKLEKVHKPSTVRFVTSHGYYSRYANMQKKTGAFISELTRDHKRNLLISKIIVRLYEDGREILVVGDRIEHLENLMALCYYSGIPDEDMGLVAGSRNVWVDQVLVTEKIKRDELTRIKQERHILFATYGMFNKGVDVPRLDAGVDVTPRSKAQQVHGRILRQVAGKRTPIWVTIRDVNSYRSETMFLKRIGDYSKSNARLIEWNLELGVRGVSASDLKRKVQHRIKVLKVTSRTMSKGVRCTTATRSTDNT